MNRLDKRLNNLPQSTVVLLEQIDSLKGQWVGGAKLNPQALGRLKRSVLASSTGASTRIEGASLSDEEVDKLMRGVSMQKMLDRDEQEVKGYYEVLSMIFDSWNDINLTESAIKHLHMQLLKYSVKDEWQRGEYKKLENRVIATDKTGQEVGTIFEPTAPYLTSKEMNELMDWLKASLNERKYHSILIVANFVVEFLKIHPFSDGNGRLSRILTNLLMLQVGYEYVPYVSLEKLIEENKTEYYIALRNSQKTFQTQNETVEPWIKYFLDVLRAQATQSLGLLTGEAIEKLLSPNQLLVWQFLQTADVATIQAITEATNVARPTVRQSVERLLTLKKIERIGQGRATRYRKL